MTGREDTGRLFAEASSLQQSGQPGRAAELYRRILGLDPEHVPSLSRLSGLALASRQFSEAETLLRQALEHAPDDPGLRINLGACLQAAGRAAESLAEFEEVLARHPKLGAAWLYLGAVRLAIGDPEGAVRAFQVALSLNPGLEQAARQPGHPARALAAQAVQATQARYRMLQNDALDALRDGYGSDALRRVERCLRIQHGLEKMEFAHPLQRPEMLYLPDVPPRPWFERSEFGWTEQVEAATDDLTEEVLALRESAEGFTPYVASSEVAPEPMKHLAGSFDWHAFHLYASGQRRDENCARCPRTTALVETLPLVVCRGTSPEAFFSLLEPGTHIKPHFGVANTKIAVHLPLVIPDECGIRVGEETRHWTRGECLMFDDSFEHEAWNRGDALRIVFIFEVWNPHLSAEECAAIRTLCAVSAEWAESVLAEETRA